VEFLVKKASKPLKSLRFDLALVSGGTRKELRFYGETSPIVRMFEDSVSGLLRLPLDPVSSVWLNP